jgi:hypothetical protein
MSGSARTQRYRARKRSGLVVLSIQIEPVTLGEWLCDLGFLETWDVADLGAIRTALEHAIAQWAQP